jgi:hypothetical protein
MRNEVTEIENVLKSHGYSINTIICNVMKTFNFKSLFLQVGFKKQEGYPISEIIALMIMLPLMMLGTVNAFYKSAYKHTTEMKKDVIYRLKNNENLPWRLLLLAVAKKFQKLTNKTKEMAVNSAFIIDDTTEAKTGRHIEKVSYIFDHVASRKGNKLGFKNLTLGLYDGKSFNALDFSLHQEKTLKKMRHRKEQFQKTRDQKSAGAKRIQECSLDKITNSLNMLKRAYKHGFRAKYVLVDSWFSSKEFIQTARNIGKKAMHVICGMRKDKRNYTYNGQSLNAKKLLETVKKERKEKRCRKRNTRYFEVIVHYEGVGDVKLYFCRFPYQKEWRLFLSTDTSITFMKMMEIYCVRWTIEVFFKEVKQHLRLGSCQSRDFDAQIAHVTTCYMLHTMLAYFRRINAYDSLGGLFDLIQDEMIEKTVAERLWVLFEELLLVVIEAVAESGSVNIIQFRNSPEYQYLKDLFEESFLSNQLKSLDKAS